MTKKILVLPGDGIGPTVTSSAVRIIEQAAEGRVEILYGSIGQSAFVKTSEYLPAETYSMATDADAILAGGVVETHHERYYNNPIRVLKKQLNLHSVVRKFFTINNNAGVQGVDMLVISGNPDVLLNLMETESLDGVNYHKFLSAASCRKLFRSAIGIARTMQRKKMTCAHRVSMFPALDGMFLDYFYKELAGQGFLMEDIEVEELAADLVRAPSSKDTIIATDIYGTVLAGVAAGMVGGSYLTPMGNIGDGSGLFEPMHGPNPKSVKKGYVNPTSTILSGAMALDYVGMFQEAEKIRKAVKHVYGIGKVTPDVGGTATTEEFTDSVISKLKNNK
jgi:isocitrate/isopropylmalate dehydrogenase